MPPTIYMPTQAEWAKIYADQAVNSPLAIYNNYLSKQNGTATTPAPGSGSAVTAAGNPNLNNLSNPDWIKAMSEMVTQLNIDAQQKANASRIPGAAGLEKQSSTNIADALAGKLPADVINQIAQASAERGVGTGNPMGASTSADLLKAIGLNSLQLQGQGQSWLDQALGRNPSGQIANTQALVTTPAQAESLALQRQGQELAYLSHLQDLAAGRYSNNHTGYGGSPSKGSSFAPATNWGSTPSSYSNPTPIAPGWSDPGNPSSPYYYNDQLFNQDLANFYPEYLYGGTPASTDTTMPANWNAYDTNPVSYNPEFYPDTYGGGDNNSLSDEEWWNLFGGG